MRTFITCFLLALTAGCASRPMQDLPNVRSGIEAAEPIMAALQVYRSNNGKYPETVDALNLPENTMANFRSYKGHYIVRERGSIYDVSFYPRGGFPAFCATGSERGGKWSCMGK